MHCICAHVKAWKSQADSGLRVDESGSWNRAEMFDRVRRCIPYGYDAALNMTALLRFTSVAAAFHDSKLKQGRNNIKMTVELLKQTEQAFRSSAIQPAQKQRCGLHIMLLHETPDGSATIACLSVQDITARLPMERCCWSRLALPHSWAAQQNKQSEWE